MTNLSPQTQAVLNAWAESEGGVYLEGDPWRLAAALRAAVEQTIPVTKSPWGSTLVPILTATESRERIFAIADELEAHE